MSNQLLLCTHGEFAREIIRSAEMIIGPMQDAIPMCLLPGMSPEEYLAQIQEQVELHKDDAILVLADLFGGTPSNCAARLTRDYPLQIITGLNLGMLLEVYSSIDQLDILELKKLGMETLQMSCVDVNERLSI